MVRISERRFWAKLGVPDPVPRGFRERLVEAERWYTQNGRPWSAARFVDVDRHGSRVRIDRPGGPLLRSEVLARGFRAAGVSRVLLVAASAGDRVDAEIAERFTAGRPDEGFFLSAYAELVAATLRRRELASCDEPLLPHYAPGYAGWDAEDLPVLVSLVGEDQGPISCPSDSVLRPLRSTVVVAGVLPAEVENTYHYWNRFGGRTCTEVCRPCTCSMP